MLKSGQSEDVDLEKVSESCTFIHAGFLRLKDTKQSECARDCAHFVSRCAQVSPQMDCEDAQKHQPWISDWLISVQVWEVTLQSRAQENCFEADADPTLPARALSCTALHCGDLIETPRLQLNVPAVQEPPPEHEQIAPLQHTLIFKSPPLGLSCSSFFGGGGGGGGGDDDGDGVGLQAALYWKLLRLNG